MRTTLCSVLVVSALALTACGNSDTPAATDRLSGSITVAAAGGEGELKALQSVADAFETAHPGTTVTVDGVAAAGELISKLTTQFAARTPPDVFVMNYRRLGGFAEKGVIEPVAAGATEGLYDGPLKAFTFDGKLLCLPSNAASMVIYLNTALFAKAGVALPKSGWTWDDLLATARALKAKGTSAIGFETALVRLAPFVWSNGGEVVDDADNPTVVDLDSPQAREALQLLLDLQKTGMSATERAAQDPEEAFSAGKIAMYLDSRRAVPGFRKTAGLEFDVAGVPTKTSAVSVLHSDGYCVTKASKNRALAQAFAAYVVSGDGAAVLASTGRSVPMKRSVATSPAFLAPDKAPKNSQVFLDQLEHVRALPHTPTWNEAEGVTEEILMQLFAGRTSIDKAIADIAAATRTELAKA